MTQPAKDRWWFIAFLVVAALLVVAFFWTGRRPEPATPEIVRELAEERIPQIEARSKATRRATRARIDHEVDDASLSRDLVDYFNSRSTK